MSITARSGRVVARSNEPMRIRGERPIFTPDPTDFTETLRVPEGPGACERRLMAAVLGDACRDATMVLTDLRNLKARAQMEDAKRYLWSDDREWLYSAANICDILGVDIDYLRRGITARLEARRAVARSRSMTQ